MNATHAIANFISLLTLLFAIMVGMGLIALLLRRRRFEAKGSSQQSEQTEIFRHLSAMLAGKATDKHFSPGAELKAISHFASLVRGDDHERLFAYAEAKGLFQEAIAGLEQRKPARRIDAVHQLERFASPTCLDALDRTLNRDKDENVRLEAAMALARANKLPPPEILIKALRLERKKLNRVHAALFRSLASRYEDDLVRLAGNLEYAELRPMIIESLGWTNNLAIVSRLAGYARDANPETRSAAIKAARHLGHPGAAAWIVPMLDDPTQPVRVQAVQACREMRVKAAIPQIQALTKDDDWWVRSRAQTALEALQPATPLTKEQAA